MTKLYNVRVYSIAVVAAQSPEQALQVARRNAAQVMLDAGDVSAEVLGEVKSEADLIDGWSANCPPYGDDEEIATILKEQPQ